MTRLTLPALFTRISAIPQSAVQVILMTVHDEVEFFNEALDLGAKAYILKECAVEEVVNAVRAVCANQSYTSQRMLQYLFRRGSRVEPGGLAALTPTERQVLKLIADYKTSREIAEVLNISPLTVKTHRRNISSKLDITGSNVLMNETVKFFRTQNSRSCV